MREGVEAIVKHLNRLSWVAVAIAAASMIAPRLAREAAKPGDDAPPAAAPLEPGLAERIARAMSSRPREPSCAEAPARADEPSVRVSRALFDDALAHPSGSGGRLAPELAGGAIRGVRVFGVSEGGPLAALGLQNGDRLERVNGVALSSPDAVVRAYDSGRDRYDVELTRRGRRVTIHYVVCG